jgi:hypothetical protein
MKYDYIATSSMNLTHHQKFDQIELGDQNSQKTKIGGSKLQVFQNKGIKTALKPFLFYLKFSFNIILANLSIVSDSIPNY